MPEVTRSWGNGGTDRDEFGLLPEKEVIRINGMERVRSIAPVSSVKRAIDLFIRQHGYPPDKVYYGGHKMNTKYLRVKVGTKSVGVDLENKEHLREGFFEGDCIGIS